MAVLEDGVPDQGMAADRQAAPDGVYGEEQDVPLADRHVDHRRAAGELTPMLQEA